MKINVKICKFNQGVDCNCKENTCINCGWNPTVAERRMKKYCKKSKGDE